jgi:hypothetical protein
MNASTAAEQPQPPQQPPPTSQEAALVKKFTRAFELLPESTGSDGMWVFRRFGYPEKDNPAHNIVLIDSADSGTALGMFATARLEPTRVELLIKGLRQRGGGSHTNHRHRPTMLGIDDANCCRRVKFLLQNVDSIRMEYYMPPTKEETDAYCASAPRPYHTAFE